MNHHDDPVPTDDRSGTELAIVLDRSGSMRPLAGTVVNEINRLVDAVTADDPSSTVSLFVFGGDRPFDVLFQKARAGHEPVLSLGEYRPGGNTPLYDAIGAALRGLSARRRLERALGEIPARPLVAVVTDGRENASRDFGARDVLGMVKRRRARGWEFLWLGAGDGCRDAHRLGFDDVEIQPWEATDVGTRTAFTTITTRTTAPRLGRLGFDRDGGAR